MEGYFKALTAALITVILSMAIGKQGKDIGVLLSVVACSMIFVAALGYLRSVMDFFHQLEEMIGLHGEYIPILIKSVGIGMVGEIGVLICSDAGNAALGKALQIAGTVLILCLSLPLFQGLLELISQILEAL